MTESPYERIDRLQVRGFVGLLIAGISPVIGDVASGWIAWPMFIGGIVVLVHSMYAMGSAR